MSWKAKKKLCGFFACLYFKQNFELFNDMVYVRRDQNQGQGQLCSLDLELKKNISFISPNFFFVIETRKPNTIGLRIRNPLIN